MRTPLKRLTMHNQIKELFRKGFNDSQIACIAGIHRETVSKYRLMSDDDFLIFLQQQKLRNRKLMPYESFVAERIKHYPACSSAQIEDWLKEHYPDFPKVTTRTIYSFVQWVRQTYNHPKPKGRNRQCHPVEELPYGQQGQVDFGELWLVDQDEHRIKVHFMIMVLSRSRRKFVRFTDQPVTTRFVLEAHELAFAFFEGMPKTLVYDQDCTLVVDENRGEVIHTAEFERYVLQRKFTVHLCRKSDPQSKGKIEAGVKYVKRNFLEGRTFVNLELLNQQAVDWLHRTANTKVHASTRLIPDDEWKTEVRYLRQYTPIPLGGIAGKLYHVRKDNTVSYRGNFYSLPLGSYEGPGTKVLLSIEGSQLLLNHQDKRLLAQHTLEHSKGKIVMNNHHRRDTTSKIKALQEELCRQFSDQQKAVLFLEMIHHRFPRYPRDQFQHIHKSISGRPKELIDNALEYCVEHHLFSSGEYHDVLLRFGKTQEKIRDVVLKEFRPITPLGDLDLIFALTPESSKITAYEQLMN